MGFKRIVLHVGRKVWINIRDQSLIRMGRQVFAPDALNDRLLPVLYLAAIVALSAGLENAILEGSNPSFAGISILPTAGAQTWNETFINILVIILGSMGLYVMYLTGRQTVRQRSSGAYLFLGLIVVLVALTLGLFLLAAKGFS